jgi:hypothetical protein
VITDTDGVVLPSNRVRWRREKEQSRSTTRGAGAASPGPPGRRARRRWVRWVVATGARVAGPGPAVVGGLDLQALLGTPGSVSSRLLALVAGLRLQASSEQDCRSRNPSRPSVRPFPPRTRSRSPLLLLPGSASGFLFSFYFSFALRMGRAACLLRVHTGPLRRSACPCVRACCTLHVGWGVQAAATAGRQVSVPGEP